MADNNSSLQDDELYLPRTVVNKLIKEIVPNIRVATDARDLLLNCCTEFIHLLASEASDISEKQLKKVISPEHVVEALTTLGFQEYIPDVKAVHKEYKEQASKHRKRGKSKLERLGIPEEELARQQQQLFDEARQQQMESELLDQQKCLQSTQQDPSAVKPSPTVTSSGLCPLAPHPTASAMPPAPVATTTNAVGDHEASNESLSATKETQLVSSSIASELLDQQKCLQSTQQDPSAVKPSPTVTSSGLCPLSPHPTASAMPPAPVATTTNAVGDHEASNESRSVTQEAQLASSSIAVSAPQKAFITAALQVTSSFLHQALTMASAQAATGQAEMSQQNTAHMSAATNKLSATALQAALAAQTQALPGTAAPSLQTTPTPLLQPTPQVLSGKAQEEPTPQVSSGKAQEDGTAPVTSSQGISVAQMMTLAQASNCSTSKQNPLLAQKPPGSNL